PNFGIVDDHGPGDVVEQNVSAVEVSMLDAASGVDFDPLNRTHINPAQLIAEPLQGDVTDQAAPDRGHTQLFKLPRTVPGSLVSPKLNRNCSGRVGVINQQIKQA